MKVQNLLACFSHIAGQLEVWSFKCDLSSWHQRVNNAPMSLLSTRSSLAHYNQSLATESFQSDLDSEHNNMTPFFSSASCCANQTLQAGQRYGEALSNIISAKSWLMRIYCSVSACTELFSLLYNIFYGDVPNSRRSPQRSACCYWICVFLL